MDGRMDDKINKVSFAATVHGQLQSFFFIVFIVVIKNQVWENARMLKMLWCVQKTQKNI